MQNQNNSPRKQNFTRSTIGGVDMVTIQSKQVLVQLPDLTTRRVALTGNKGASKIDIELMPDLALDKAGKRDEKGQLLNLKFRVPVNMVVRIYALPERRAPKPQAPAENTFEPIETVEHPSGQTNQESGQDVEEDEAPVVPAQVLRHIKLPNVG